MTCFGKKIALFYREISVFFICELWVLNMTSETAELYILDNLSSTNMCWVFFPKEKNKTCPPNQALNMFG